MEIPFFSFDKRNQDVREESIKAFEKFFDSKWYVLGNNTSEFEQNFARFNQVQHAIGVSSGLDALHLSLLALGIGKGDEVIVPSNTYIASVLSISFTGATPVFVEPRYETANLNPELIKAAISSKTKAIMPVHLYGQACEMDAIMAIAKEHGLYVVEDNAQSQGALHNGRITGSFGDINATSFYPTKNLGALGEAGAITTNSESLAQAVKSLRNYGSSERYYNEVKGYNNRIDEFEAAYLNIALNHLNSWNEERSFLAAEYQKRLKDVKRVELFECAPGSTSVNHLFVVKASSRDALRKELADKGIGTQIHYPVPPHLQEAYSELGFKAGYLKIAEKLSQEVISLPLWLGMDVKMIDEVCRVIESSKS